MNARHAAIVGVGQLRRRPELDGPFEPWEPARMSVLSNQTDRIAAADGGFDSVELPAADVTGPRLVDAVSGAATIETYTVVYDRSGAALQTVFVVRLDDGTRTVGHGGADPSEIAAITEHEAIGRRCLVTAGRLPTTALPADHRLAGADLGEPNRVVLL